MNVNRIILLFSFALILSGVSLVSAQLSVYNIQSGPTSLSYGQNTTINMIITGGIGAYTANLIWCKPQPPYPGGSCTLPSGALANTISASLPAGNYLTFTVNAYSYNTLYVTFNGVTYDIVTNAYIPPTSNIIAATNSMDPSNALFANTIYGAWSFNGVVTDSGANTLLLSQIPMPNSLPTIGINPATPQLQYLAPGGFLAFVTNYGNDTLSLIKINPSNILASNIVATIPVGAGPVSLVSPPQQFSASAPSLVSTVNYLANSVTMINTATREAITNMSLGAGTSPMAVAPESNNIAQGMAFAEYGTDSILIISPQPDGTFSSFTISLSGKISGPDAVSTFFDRTGGSTLWVAGKDSNSVVPINLTTMQVGNAINLGAGAEPEGIATAPFGYVYVADYGTNMISVINASSSTPGIVTNITGTGPTAFDGPSSLTADYSSPKVYVTNYNSNSISIFDGMSYRILQVIPVNSLTVSNPDQVSVSPDGTLLYVSNFGANDVSVLKTSDYSVQGTLQANEPTGVSLFSNFFYNGSTPSDIVFQTVSPGNQLTAALSVSNSPGSFIPTGLTTTNVLSYPVNSASSNSFMFIFSTGGNANYFPSIIAKSFDIMPSFPSIQMKMTLANGLVVVLNKQSQALSLTGLPNALFPMTLTVNVVTFGNQLPANIFLNGVSVNTLTQGFTTVYNSLPTGTQSFVFNSVGNGNYIPIDPQVSLEVQSASTTSTTTTVATTTVSAPFTGGLPPQSSTIATTATTSTAATTTIAIVRHIINVSNPAVYINRSINISSHSPLYLNFTNSKVRILITSTTPSNSSANVLVTNVTNMSSLPGFSGMTRQLALNISVTPPDNVSINVTLAYECGMNASVAPYMLTNGTWTLIRPYNIDASACTVSFTVPADPVVALYSAAPNNSTLATTSMPASSVQTTIAQQQQSASSNTLVLYVVVAIVVILLIAAFVYVYTRRRK